MKYLALAISTAFLMSCVSVQTPAAIAASAPVPVLELKHVRGGVYVVEDNFYIKENSAVYIGPDHVTVIGATWTPETARLLAEKIRGITDKPIREVINTNFHTDRAGGNAFWHSIGAEIIATQMTSDAMRAGWQDVVEFTQKGVPAYPALPLVMPTRTEAGDFALQDGRVRAIYLGPSHTQDGIFVYFPQERVLYGNCILKQELGNLSYANLAEYPKTLDKLKGAGLDFDMVIAGHQDALHGPGLIDHYQALLKAR